MTISFKHAFREGKIDITFVERGDELYIIISDNGVGLTEGFSLQERDSLGITLIYNLLQQLNADWKFYSNNGTTLEFSFSLDEVKGSSAATLLDA